MKRSLLLAMFVLFILLSTVFVFFSILARRRVRTIIDGMIQYADNTPSFRFTRLGHSEFSWIGHQFNSMANDIESNRQKSFQLEKMASWQTIARKMAHEIKNPLTPIQILIGQLKRSYDGDNEKYTQLLEKSHRMILEEVSNLRRMVEDFSEFARLPEARLESDDLCTTFSGSWDMLKDAYAPHTIKCVINVKRPCIISHDRALIKQLIQNLVKNACEASEHAISVTMSLTEEKNTAIISIHDSGPGIPEDLKSKIFEAYVTTKHTGPTPGMGLGLTICHKIALEHKGNLTFESQPGSTTFTVSIPKNSGGAE